MVQAEEMLAWQNRKTAIYGSNACFLKPTGKAGFLHIPDELLGARTLEKVNPSYFT